MTKKITDALSKLDVGNDAHWTAEGAPRIETLRILAGDSTLTREDINKAANDFTRDSARKAAVKTAEPVKAPASAGTTPSEMANPDELKTVLSADKMPGDAHLIPEKATVVNSDNATEGMPGEPSQVIRPLDAEGKTPVAQPLEIVKQPLYAEGIPERVLVQRPDGTLKAAEAELDAKYAQREQLNADIAKAEQARDFHLAELGHNVPSGDNPKETQEAIQEYLKMSAKNREERAARQNAQAKALADLGGPIGPSALDQSMMKRSRQR